MNKNSKYYDYEISSAQRRIYVLDKIAGKSTVYNMPSVIELNGYMKLEEIEYAIKKVITRHDSLRTAFFINEGEVVQRVYENVDFSIEHYIIKQNSEIGDIVKKFVQPFCLEEAPLMRAAIIENESTQYLLLDMHHIISDGKSETIFMNDFYAYIRGEELPVLSFQYKDYVENDTAIRKNEKYMKKAKEFWIDAFSEQVEPLKLPTDFMRQEIQQFDGARKVFKVDKELTSRIIEVCEQYKVTMNHYLMTVYFVMLSKISGQEDIVVGTPVSSRRNSEQEKVIGLFLNTLPIRAFPKAEKKFSELLAEVKRYNFMAMKYQNYSIDMLVQDVKFHKDLSRNPVFDVAFLFNSNIVLDSVNSEKYYQTNNAKVDLTMEITNSDDQIVFLMEYCTGLYKPETCEKFGNTFLRGLEQVTENPEIIIGDIEKIDEIEKEKILYEWNKTEYNYDKTINVNYLLDKKVNEQKNAKSLSCMDESLLYDDMDKKAKKFASYLREQGIGRNDIVAIAMNPKIEMVIAILGIIRAGAAYLPVAVDTPEQRIKYILEDSGAKMIVSDCSHFTLDNMCLFDQTLYAAYSAEIENINEANDLIYVIYTSGSTGNPKGVMVKHSNVVNFVYGINNAIQMEKHESILLLTTICFDISVLEVIVPLILGMEVFIVEHENQSDMRFILDYIEKNKIDMLQFTPSRFQMLTLVPGWELKLRNVMTLLIGGEGFPASLLEKVFSLPNTKVFNVYGPTETTIWSTVEEITNEKITIGKPIANTQIYILDNKKKCVSVGEVGEIYIGGDGVTQGYINNVTLTAEKFTVNPYTGDIMYATGDLGRWTEEGKIECLGRIDFQVKIRGYRIEIGEIEHQIKEYEGVDNAVVVDYVDQNDNKYLCAYIEGKLENFSNLKLFLEKSLPAYMIPSFFVKLDTIPLNQNGKVNRKMLPLPQRKVSEKKEKTKDYSVEIKKIIEVWKNVLNLEEIGIDEDFFDLGGNSLLAIKADLLFEEKKIAISGQNIYQYRTIRKLSELFEKEQVEESEVIHSDNIMRYADDAIVVENIQPYNDMFFESCFYNSMFSILIMYNIDISTLIRQYYLAYKMEEDSGRKKIYAKGQWNKEMMAMLKNVGLMYSSWKQVDSVSRRIKEAIRKGHPVVLWIDCFYETYRQEKYQKEHFKHTVTVFGYSDLKEEFYILEHKVADNTNYNKIAISYKELEECYSGYLSNFMEDNDNSIYEFWMEEASESKMKLLDKEEFIKSQWKKEVVIHWKDYFANIKPEDVNTELIEYWLSGLNELINSLRVDVMKYKYQVNYSEAEKRLYVWEVFRNSLVRALYKSCYTSKLHEKNIELLDNICSYEEQTE